MVLMQQVLNASHARVGAASRGSVTHRDDDWCRLCELHTPSLLTFTLRLTGGDRVRAEAIAQRTLLLAWHNADRLGSTGAIRPWLMTTARRLAAGQETAVRDLLYAMDDAGRANNLAQVLGRLAPEQRAALAEVCGDRKTVSAAARAAGVSTRVIKLRVFEALETIRSSMPQRELAH
jgi:RNA polymerase sigma-70 factor, ECF subfamily